MDIGWTNQFIFALTWGQLEVVIAVINDECEAVMVTLERTR